MGTISLEGLSKSEVLAALFNRSKPQGLGFLNYDSTPMTDEQASERFGDCEEYFDYLDGRVMKVDLAGDELGTSGYNRDNGEGAAEAVINGLRSARDVNAEDIQSAHIANTRESAIYTRDNLMNKPTSKEKGDILEIELTASWAADELTPKLDDIIGED